MESKNNKAESSTYRAGMNIFNLHKKEKVRIHVEINVLYLSFLYNIYLFFILLDNN